MSAMALTPPPANPHRPNRQCLSCLIVLTLVSLHLVSTSAQLDLPLDKIKLPNGFQVALYFKDALSGVRFLCPSKSDARVVYASTPDSDAVCGSRLCTYVSIAHLRSTNKAIDLPKLG